MYYLRKFCKSKTVLDLQKKLFQSFKDFILKNEKNVSIRALGYIKRVTVLQHTKAVITNF